MRVVVYSNTVLTYCTNDVVRHGMELAFNYSYATHITQ